MGSGYIIRLQFSAYAARLSHVHSTIALGIDHGRRKQAHTGVKHAHSCQDPRPKTQAVDIDEQQLSTRLGETVHRTGDDGMNKAPFPIPDQMNSRCESRPCVMAQTLSILCPFLPHQTVSLQRLAARRGPHVFGYSGRILICRDLKQLVSSVRARCVPT